MEKDDKGSTMIRMGVSGGMFLLVPAYPGCPRSRAVKRSLFGHGDSVNNTVEENSRVFYLVRMHWLPSARACRQ